MEAGRKAKRGKVKGGSADYNYAGTGMTTKSGASSTRGGKEIGGRHATGDGDCVVRPGEVEIELDPEVWGCLRTGPDGEAVAGGCRSAAVRKTIHDGQGRRYKGTCVWRRATTSSEGYMRTERRQTARATATCVRRPRK